MTKKLNIIFAGTPPFTLPCLEALSKSEHNLIAVYTQPDRPSGRGRTLQQSAVKEWSIAHNIPIYQPINFKDPATVQTLKELKPDLMIVIAYGIILPQVVLDIPQFGCINVHASLLPQLRGAAPIQHSILHGHEETGVTIMQMDAGMDTGAMIKTATCSISSTDTSETLHDKLSHLAVPTLLETLDLVSRQQITLTPQNPSLATYASKINKTDAAINWHQPAEHIDRLIRAYYPWPIAYTNFGALTIRVHKAHILNQHVEDTPGTIIMLDKHGMQISTTNGVICVEQIQLPGSKVVKIADAIHANNFPLHVGLILQ